MGRKSESGGVAPKRDRIQLTFTYEGKRVRPTLELAPTRANLKRAARMVEDINRKIKIGTFDFAAEFPDYRNIQKVAPPTTKLAFKTVAANYMDSVPGTLARATSETYRKILDKHWLPKFGERAFLEILPSEIKSFLGSLPGITLKTRNNILCVARCVFTYGYDDYPKLDNPCERVKCVRFQKPDPDPLALAEAESVISSMHTQDDRDFVEFQFFVGCRPSETIMVSFANYDETRQTLKVHEARVDGKYKDTTKTKVARYIELNPRANALILRRLKRYKERQLAAPPDQPLNHDRIFTMPDGTAYRDTQRPEKQWRRIVHKLPMRYREGYQARHTSVTWNLMIGKNILWVAQNHGHSAATMLKTYARWMANTTEEEIAQLSAAMGFATNMPPAKVKKG